MSATGRVPGLQYTTIAELLPASPFSFVIQSLKFTARSAPYIGLFTLPLTLFFRPPPIRGGTATYRAIATGCALFMAGLFCTLWWSGRALPQMGHHLMVSGLGPLTLTDTWLREPVVPFWLQACWLMVTALGCFSLFRIFCFALAVGMRAAQSGRIAEPWLHALLATVVVSYWFLTCLLVYNSQLPTDRYSLFIVPMLTIWMVLPRAAPGEQPSAAAAVAVLLAFGAFAVAGTHDYLAWNRTRWAATDYLTQEQHIPPQKIDGGYEFNGSFLYTEDSKRHPGNRHWWIVDDEYVVATRDRKGYAQIRRFPYRRWLPPYGESILVLQRTPEQ
jgi:hypothetical protein